MCLIRFFDLARVIGTYAHSLISFAPFADHMLIRSLRSLLCSRTSRAYGPCVLYVTAQGPNGTAALRPKGLFQVGAAVTSNNMKVAAIQITSRCTTTPWWGPI